MGDAVMDAEELKALTYPRLNLNDHTLDDNLPEFTPQRPRLPPQYTASLLETLPLEIIHEILAQLDLRSLMNFRYVNRRAAQFVESEPHYKTIAKHAPNAMRGILFVQSGAWITCERLHQKLLISECEECGDYAAYLYIITCRRVCFLCFSENTRYLPLGADLIRRRYGLSRRLIQDLPGIKVSPGVYSPGKCKITRSMDVFDYESTLDAAILHHGSLDAVTNYIADVQNRLSQEYASKRENALMAGANPSRVRSPAALFPYDRKSSNSLRFVAIVTIPCLSQGSSIAEWGFYCNGCRNFNSRPLHWRRRFLANSFAKHLRECGVIQDGRHRLP